MKQIGEAKFGGEEGCVREKILSKSSLPAIDETYMYVLNKGLTLLPWGDPRAKFH